MTVRYLVEACFGYESDDGSEMVEFLDAVVDHLQDALRATELLVTSHPDGRFNAEVVVSVADDEHVEHAVAQAMTQFRTAFHACDAATTEWPTPSDAVEKVRVRLLQSSQRQLQPA